MQDYFNLREFFDKEKGGKIQEKILKNQEEDIIRRFDESALKIDECLDLLQKKLHFLSVMKMGIVK